MFVFQFAEPKKHLQKFNTYNDELDVIVQTLSYKTPSVDQESIKIIINEIETSKSQNLPYLQTEKASQLYKCIETTCTRGNDQSKSKPDQ